MQKVMDNARPSLRLSDPSKHVEYQRTSRNNCSLFFVEIKKLRQEEGGFLSPFPLSKTPLQGGKGSVVCTIKVSEDLP